MSTTVERFVTHAPATAPIPHAVARPRVRHSPAALVRRALLAADVLALAVAFAAAETIGAGSQATPVELASFLLIVPLWVVGAKLFDLYGADERLIGHSTVDEIDAVVLLDTAASWVLFAVATFVGHEHELAVKLLVFWACAAIGVPLARAAARTYSRRRIQCFQNTVIVGAGDVGQALARKFLRHREYGINVVGFVDREPKQYAPDLQHVKTLCVPEDLPELVRALDVERVVFAFSVDGHAEGLHLIRTLSDMRIQVDIVPRFYEVIGGGVDLHSVEGMPVIGLPPCRLSPSSRLLKRALDLCGAAAGLVLLAPLLLFVAALIKLESPGPVFFHQVRAGARGSTFRIWKFRTMIVDADAHKDEVRHLSMHAKPGGDSRMFKIADDPRVTRVGRVLRRLSIDELPQLFNVVVGDMSLVGPRPLILEEDMHVRDWARHRLDLKPGITGLWQVLGRNDISFEEMVRLDYVYVTGWSLASDARLILRTIPVLFGVKRAY